ncbi:hypothetical protein [Hungatella hathewayi]|uniref:hypothetical protein n=1 Tax=Hungatella hathewayi TaxID=154046 RepID=UPI001FAA0D1C|nr:hypothetical protein [Hungatella hathewayi]
MVEALWQKYHDRSIMTEVEGDDDGVDTETEDGGFEGADGSGCPVFDISHAG